MLTATLLVVVSSLLWSTLDLLRKILAGKIPSRALLALLTGGAVPLFLVWAIVEGEWRIAPGYVWPAVGSIVLNVVANLAFFESMRRAPLSTTIPLLSFTPVFATLLAIPLLGELPRPAQGLGILLVVIGALALGRPARASAGSEPAPSRFASSRFGGALLMLFVALLWAATISLDKVASARSTSAVHALLLTAGIFVAALAILLVRGELRELRAAAEVPGVLAGALVVSAVALGVQFVAMQTLMISLIETLKRGIGNLAAVISGRLVFGEPITPLKLVAVSLLALGVGIVLLN